MPDDTANLPADGWYIVNIADDGPPTCVLRAAGTWIIARSDQRSELPPGWTLGPNIEHMQAFIAAQYDRYVLAHGTNTDGR